MSQFQQYPTDPRNPQYQQTYSMPGYGPNQEFQFQQDNDHLRILSILFYVMGGITIATSLFFLIYIVLGILMMSGEIPVKPGDPSPRLLGGMFIFIGSLIIVIGGIFGLLSIKAGRDLAKRKSYDFLMVMSGLNCINVPLGTLLGVFTILVLSRPGVKAQFGKDIPPPLPPAGPQTGQW